MVCVAKNLNVRLQLNSTFEVVQMSMDLMKTLLYRLHVTAVFDDQNTKQCKIAVLKLLC